MHMRDDTQIMQVLSTGVLFFAYNFCASSTELIENGSVWLSEISKYTFLERRCFFVFSSTVFRYECVGIKVMVLCLCSDNGFPLKEVHSIIVLV